MHHLPSFGVEEEFLLVDPETGEPAPVNNEVAVAAQQRGVKLQLELSSCQVETTSEVAASSAELGAELKLLRRTAAQAAEASGVRLLALGLPPVTPHEFPVTDTERYRRIGAEFGMIAHEQGISGCHVHVQVPGRAAAIKVSNWLRPWLPSLLALSANSAVYRSADTGYASWRSILWRRWPAAGPPPFFASPEQYDRTVRMLIDSGVILDHQMIYWDVRPSANFPTVEVRVADVPATVEETVLLATLIRAAVMTALEADGRGDDGARLPPAALRAAYWKAAHDGLSGQLLDSAHDHAPVPARQQLDALVQRVRPALDELGEYDHVQAELDRVLAEGNGAMRQRKAWERRGDVMDVIAQAAAATQG
ncbi:glutamate--cysteine ligase 2 [Mycobacterium montefiorense]|uniref:glutamate--cysteine ligase 2 n=1 Tax=Mycobacterium montefiorense TaxID=154654 RepID=UPI0021DDC450|nr:glutamate--cysteine ligase [Mycobacterium montefiorense]MCV7428082.1 glutamate--cysteine ligase [Mycobacterium montefiorense]GLE52518.1 putative glutamate--cysteine ligase 2-3 [Mycobacterium montefiorense]